MKDYELIGGLIEKKRDISREYDVRFDELDKYWQKHVSYCLDVNVLNNDIQGYLYSGGDVDILSQIIPTHEFRILLREVNFILEKSKKITRKINKILEIKD